MPNFRKLLAPTDFSEDSILAVERARSLAADWNAELLLVHVAEEARYPTASVMSHSSFPNLKDELRKAHEREAREFAQKLGDANLPILTRQGVPSVEIADVAGSEGVDLIVIATHGAGGLRRFLLGSTTERLIRIAPCSVLVVRPEAPKG